MSKPENMSFSIPTEKIGAVIGSGGRVIKEIIKTTGAKIDIGDDGLVQVSAPNEPSLEKAVSWIKILGGSIEVGATYPGLVRRIMDFGMFVEIVPGQDGLVHVSTVPREEQETFFKSFNENDRVSIEVINYDRSTGRIGLKIV